MAGPDRSIRWRDLTPLAKVIVLILALTATVGALIIGLLILFLFALIATHGTIHIT